MDAKGIRQNTAASEVGQKSDGVAVSLTDSLRASQFNCEKLALTLALHSVSLATTERIHAISIP